MSSNRCAGSRGKVTHPCAAPAERVSAWELRVGMRPLSAALQAFPSWLEVGSVWERLGLGEEEA